MLISDSLDAFSEFARDRGLDLKEPSSVRDVALAWLDFFRDVRITDGTVEEGAVADGLLFEWGTRQALPGYYESAFYINLTRQFIASEGEDDDAIFQLVWQVEYEPTEEFRSIGHYNEWCDTPTAYSYFKDQVLLSQALAKVAAGAPGHIKYFFTGV